MDWEYWEKIFEEAIQEKIALDDPAHDILHFRRVVHLAKKLCNKEGGQLEIVIPAAWLHDFVIVAKDSPLRSQASCLAAQEAQEFLTQKSYPAVFIAPICHAIEAHSFSANIPPQTLEAKIVQDADRLDALGAIGIARCFAIAGLLKRPFYHNQDPFCTKREPDDSTHTLDHFYVKLFKVANSLTTTAGQKEGQRRIREMTRFLKSLALEIGMPHDKGF